MRFDLSSAALDPAALAVALADPEAGALATFEGRVRRHHDGRTVTHLEYEAYAELACHEGRRIIEAARARYAIRAACCVHRVGRLAVGDVAVWVGVTAVHRAPALQACAFIIDAVKDTVPIWKKEHFAGGDAQWVNCAAALEAASAVRSAVVEGA